MKDFAIYDLENDRYYPEGRMTIEHEDWAFMRELDGFVPTWYNIKIEVEDGVSYYTWNIIYHAGPCGRK